MRRGHGRASILRPFGVDFGGAKPVAKSRFLVAHDRNSGEQAPGIVALRRGEDGVGWASFNQSSLLGSLTLSAIPRTTAKSWVMNA